MFERDSPPAARTVVLVEDEAALRGLIRRVLEPLHFEVLEARNGAEALTLARNHTGPVHLLITDVVLPNMDGFDLWSRFGRLHPESRVLFMSGYADESVAVRGGLKETGEPFLLKPFNREALARTLRQIFGDP